MKSAAVKIIFLIAAALSALFLCSCAADVYFDVGFDTKEGGSVVAVLRAEAGMTLPAPEREGYILDGWFYDEEFTRPFSPEDAEGAKGDITVYARWAPVTHTVVFSAGAGVKTSDAELLTQSVGHGSAAAIPYLFKSSDKTAVVGWYTDAALTQSWDPDAPVTSDLTVYPRFGDYYDSVYLNAPKIYIQTSKNKPIVSKEEYLECRITITNTEQSPLSLEPARIRGRGNTTWTTISDKKAYRIKFDKKTDLFGMGLEKDYVLLANYRDYTLMRNDLVFRTAAKLGLEYTSLSQWTHVFLNGEYLGLYLLCEQTETGANRVDIGKEDAPGADERPGCETGYLLEVDGAGDYGDNAYFKFDPIRTADAVYAWRSSYTVTVKSPGGEYITEAQLEYIEEYVNSVNRAIALRDWSTLCELCDIDSFVNSFIINELSYSVDMGWAFFLYKPAGEKLHYGPVWDYDQGFGSSDLGGIAYNSWRSGEENLWFTWLLECPAFRTALKARFNEIYDSVILSMDNEITVMYNTYINDINANYVRWDKTIGYPCWRLPQEIERLKTYEANVDYLRKWLSDRIDWMEGEINGR